MQQVGTDESREPKPVHAVEQRTALRPERQGQQNKSTGDDSDDALGGHVLVPLMILNPAVVLIDFEVDTSCLIFCILHILCHTKKAQRHRNNNLILNNKKT